MIELLIIHTLDNREVIINTTQITEIQEARQSGDPDKRMDPHVKCIIALADGRFVSTAETCEDIHKRLEPEEE
jgi:hypothetical protein